MVDIVLSFLLNAERVYRVSHHVIHTKSAYSECALLHLGIEQNIMGQAVDFLVCLE
jgi:hypothetical protein